MNKNNDGRQVVLDVHVFQKLVAYAGNDMPQDVMEEVMKHARKFNTNLRHGSIRRDKQAARAKEMRQYYRVMSYIAQGLPMWLITESDGIEYVVPITDIWTAAIDKVQRVRNKMIHVKCERGQFLVRASSILTGEEAKKNYCEQAQKDRTQKMLEIVQRREDAGRNLKPCEFCGSEQVQLTNWFGTHNEYKCRKCGKKWRKLPVAPCL